jgi:hypothetical protein
MMNIHYQNIRYINLFKSKLFLFSLGILDLKEVSTNELKDMDQGNKLAVLCGDYLLASACNNLSKLHNNQVKIFI